MSVEKEFHSFKDHPVIMKEYKIYFEQESVIEAEIKKKERKWLGV